MIEVTGLNKKRWGVNPDLIERVHESPDTTLIMIDGATHVILEPMSEVIAMIVAFRARVLAAARDLPEAIPDPGHRNLSVVPNSTDHARQ